MKTKIFKIVLLLSTIFVSACSTTRNSYSLAEEGQSTLEIANLQASKADIHSTALKVLAEDNWNIISSANPIKVEKLYLDTHSRLLLKIYSGKVSINSEGSTKLGSPFVPLDLMQDIEQSLIKNLRTPDYMRYNSVD